MSVPAQDAPQPPTLKQQQQPDQRALEAKVGGKPAESVSGAENSFGSERTRCGHKAATVPMRMPGREAAREALIQQAHLIDEQKLDRSGPRQVVHRRNYENDAFVQVAKAGAKYLLGCTSVNTYQFNPVVAAGNSPAYSDSHVLI
jgi:hypothetical protein